MSKIAFTALLNRPDTVLSPHFGKAKWIMIRDDAGNAAFEQNTGLNGRAVVDILRRAECTDVISTEMGEGAARQLQQAGIRAWAGPADVAVPTLAQMFARGELVPLSAKPHEHAGCCQGSGAHAGGGHGHKGGCCCH
ncbi:MAG: NifB/NifX family molybdenum-iron cluster-binding protein [Acidobacteriota bacterium]